MISSTEIKKALARKHEDDFFMTEVKNGPSYVPKGQLKILDALAMKKSWVKNHFTAYEIKISRSDFINDTKWVDYLGYCNFFYWVCPTGLIKKHEVDDRCGLIYYNDKVENGLRIMKKALFRDVQFPPEMATYIIMNKIDSDRIPFYSTKEEYWRDWLLKKISTRRLSMIIKSQLVKRLADAEENINTDVEKSSLEKLLGEYGWSNYYRLLGLLRKLKSENITDTNQIDSLLENTEAASNRIGTAIKSLSGIKSDLDNFSKK